MNTVLVQYVGEKPLKEDNIAGTGVAWLGHGDVQPVPVAAWPKLAVHSGVWRLADGQQPVAPRALDNATITADQVIKIDSISAMTASAASVAAGTLAPSAETVLYGADLPAQIDIDGVLLQLGTIVAAAHQESGLTVAEWNALSDAERTARVTALIDAAREDAAEDKRKAQAAGQEAGQVADAKPQSYADLKKEAVSLGIEVKGNPKREELQALVDAKKGA